MAYRQLDTCYVCKKQHPPLMTFKVLGHFLCNGCYTTVTKLEENNPIWPDLIAPNRHRKIQHCKACMKRYKDSPNDSFVKRPKPTINELKIELSYADSRPTGKAKLVWETKGFCGCKDVHKKDEWIYE